MFVLFTDNPTSIDITVNTILNSDQHISVENNSVIPLNETDSISIKVNTECAKPAAKIVWARENKILNKTNVTSCTNPSYYDSSASEFTIINATNDDFGELTLKIIHTIVSDIYNIQLGK